MMADLEAGLEEQRPSPRPAITAASTPGFLTSGEVEAAAEASLAAAVGAIVDSHLVDVDAVVAVKVEEVEEAPGPSMRVAVSVAISPSATNTAGEEEEVAVNIASEQAPDAKRLKTEVV